MAHIPGDGRPPPRTDRGWICPGCGHGYAPWVSTCACCPQRKEPQYPVSLSAAPDAAYLQLPGEMLGPHYVRRIRIDTEWREVWDGLQVRWGGSWNGEPAASVEFRLTPQDRSE